jgi:hypothetical protein
LEQQTPLRAGNDSNADFADFANFDDNCPVVQSWNSGSSSSASGRKEADDCASDSLEAILEAQVASLGPDGSIEDFATFPE